MVSAYAAFANGGIGVRPYTILTVRTANGRLLYRRHPYNYGRVIEPRYVAMMNGMMEETLKVGTAKKADLPGWQDAGKTGTSQDFRDAWFIGYTSKLVTGVWLGNDDNSPTKKATGGGLPVEIWTRFMKAAHQGVPVASLPNSQAAGFFSNLAQASPPANGPQVAGPQATASQITNPAPASLAPSAGGYRPAPTRTSTRPEAAAGLDGWLMQRLFGGR